MFKKQLPLILIILLAISCSPNTAASESTALADHIATSVAMTLGATVYVMETAVSEPLSTPEPLSTVIPASVPTGDSTLLTTDYENALPVEMQMIVGTLKIEQAGHDIDPEQAALLLPLWQGLQSLVSDESDQSLITSQLTQIIHTMTLDQITAISAMQVTQDDLASIASEFGLEMGPGSGSSAGRGGGDGQVRSPDGEVKDGTTNSGALENGMVGRGGGGGVMRINTGLLDSIIAFLEVKAQ